MARGWALRILACLAAAAVLVTGCSHKHEPSSTAPTTTSATASPTLPPVGPPDMPMPADARQMTADGFNAFTKYYIELINRLGTHLEGKYLRQLSTSCETCNRIANDADSDAQKGYSYQGGTITITSIAPAYLSGTKAESAFIVDQAAYVVLDAGQHPVDGLSENAIASMAAGMSGNWTGDHWIVTNLSFG